MMEVCVQLLVWSSWWLGEGAVCSASFLVGSLEPN